MSRSAAGDGHKETPLQVSGALPRAGRLAVAMKAPRTMITGRSTEPESAATVVRVVSDECRSLLLSTSSTIVDECARTSIAFPGHRSAPQSASIWELRPDHHLLSAAALIAHCNHWSHPSVILLVSPRAACFRELFRVVDLPNIHVLMVDQAFPTIPVALRRVEQGTPATAITPILRAIAPAIPLSLGFTVAAATAIAVRRRTVRELARTCETPPRTLEWRLARAGLPTARILLSDLLVLHAIWKMEVLQWPAKRVAGASGFPTREAFSNFVERHTGYRPARCIATIGFSQLLSELRAKCATSDS